jgi:hypothetical protein
MKKENLPDELFDWLADKSYQELSAAEKAVVDQSIGQAEYETLQGVVRDVQGIDAIPSFKPADLSADASKQAAWKRMLWYPIPAYQVAAGLLLLLVSTLIFRGLWQKEDLNSNAPIEVVVKGIPIDQDQYPEALVFEL